MIQIMCVTLDEPTHHGVMTTNAFKQQTLLDLIGFLVKSRIERGQCKICVKFPLIDIMVASGGRDRSCFWGESPYTICLAVLTALIDVPTEDFIVYL